MANCISNIACMQNIALVSPVSPSVQPLQALKLAIELDDLHLCEKAIAEGASSESRLPHCKDNTALSYCVQMNRPRIAEFFVSKGVSSVSVAHGFTLFHFAVQWNYIELLKDLLQKHSSELLQNLLPLHPMHIAILVSAKECVKLMLNHKFRGNASVLDSPSTLNKTARYTESLPLCNAPTTYTEHAIIFLANVLTNEPLDRQWEKHIVGDHFLGDAASCAPLHLAALVGDCDSVKVLLAAGSRLDAANSRYDTALHIAAKNRDCAVTEILLDCGASIFTQNICLETPPMVAAAKGHLRNLQALSRQDIDFEARNFGDERILHLAAKSGSIESFAHILNIMQDFDLETECGQGFSILGLAFACSKNGMSFLLNLKLSSRLNASHQINILTAAILNHSMTNQHLKMLLKRLPFELLTPVLNNRAEYGGTPLYAACVAITPHREIGIINLLLDAGASIDKDGGPYGSPLMAACTMGRIFAVKLLISRGAQTTFIRGHQTTNVLHAARNFPDIIHWLLIGRFTEGPRLLTLGFGVK